MIALCGLPFCHLDPITYSCGHRLSKLQSAVASDLQGQLNAEKVLLSGSFTSEKAFLDSIACGRGGWEVWEPCAAMLTVWPQ